VSSLHHVWAYRSFILGCIQREFQLKYQNTLLSGLWVILNPLAMILIYMVIFSKIMLAKIPGIDSTFSYGIYLCSGLLAWNFFSEIVGRSQVMLLENANLLKKISFPKFCIPIIIIGSALINFGIVFSLFSIFLVFTGTFPGILYLGVISLVVVLIIFAIGIGSILAMLNVFFRDIGYFFGIFLQFWFWLTPIVYPITIIPEVFRPYIQWNPMSIVIGGFHQIFIVNRQPDWQNLTIVLLISVFLCYVSYRLFRKHSSEIMDEL